MNENIDLTTENVPNPGSREAVKMGCKCPVLDNNHGRGVSGRGELFWHNPECPIHFPKDKECGEENA